jgi:CubicO group peptidase (beta-lactamase class C family)
MKPEVAEVTLAQVLTHTAGFVPDEAPDGQAFAAAADPVADILAAGSGKSAFAYSNAGAQLMSAILVEATGTSILAYARSRLFDPLGIDTRPAAEPQLKASEIGRYEAADFAWPVDKAGLHQAWAYLKLRPDDLVKIGALYLNQGRWDGKQVVPASWVKEATTRHVDASDGLTDGYGFQWWVGKVDETPTYMAWGYGGQLIQVVPEHRLVIAVATELRFDDPNSRGVGVGPLTYLVESAIIREFTDPRGPES